MTTKSDIVKNFAEENTIKVVDIRCPVVDSLQAKDWFNPPDFSIKKLKIAFDVQGTLEGPDSAKVVKLFDELQKLGHECYIWSFGGHGMARDAADSYGLRPVACLSKRYKELDSEPEFDICIDDDKRTAEILDAKKVIYVTQIPEIKEESTWIKFMTSLIEVAK